MRKKFLCATACALMGVSLLSMDVYAEELATSSDAVIEEQAADTTEATEAATEENEVATEEATEAATEEAVEQTTEAEADDASQTDDAEIILEAQDEVIAAETADESGDDGNKYYNINVNGGEWDGTYYKLNGEIIYNAFFCDGTYTYYLQADGTPMKDRLTYHPDKVHIIYFDENGHEVFSNFHHVKKSIAGEDVDDLCFFDVYGYMYVDKRTYDQAGVNQYYVNEYGVIERNGWFQYSSKYNKAYGYANSDGTLFTGGWTYNWKNDYVFVQADGTVARSWLYDGVQYYRLDDEYGTLLGTYSKKPVGATYKKTSYYEDGSRQEHTYIVLEDDEEDCTEYKYYYANGKVAYEETYSKNKEGRYRNCTRSASYNEDGSVKYIRVSEYDKDDQTLSEKKYDVYGNITAEGSRVYNADGSYSYIYNEPSSEDVCKYEIKYDAKGRLLYDIYTYQDGTVHTGVEHVYTDNADGTYVEEYAYSSGLRYVIVHQTKDILINRSVYYSNGNSEYTEYTYIKDRNFETKRTYNEIKEDSSVYSYTYEYAYDTEGNIIKESYMNSEGDSWIEDYVIINGESRRVKYVRNYIREDNSVYTSTREYTYNANGDRIKETFMDSDGDSSIYDYIIINGESRCVKSVSNSIREDLSIYTSTREYTYDENGNRIKETYMDTDGKSWIYDYVVINGESRCVKSVSNSIREDNSVYTSTTEYTYDSNGNKVKETYMDTDGDSWIYEYSIIAGKSCCVKYVHNTINEDNSVYTSTTEYAYDEYGRRIKESTSNSNDYISIYEYVYINDIRYCIKSEYSGKYSDGSTYSSKYEYEYDEEGNKIKETYTGQNGYSSVSDYKKINEKECCIKRVNIRTMSDGSNATETYEYEYDEEGNEVKETYQDTNGNTTISDYVLINGYSRCIKSVTTGTNSEGTTYTNTYEYEYDSEGNKTKQTYSDSDGSTTISDYVVINGYSYCVKSVSTRTNSNGTSYSYTYEYEYNEKGKMTKQTYSSSGGYSYMYEYEYDENGNRVKQIYTDSNGNKTETTY